MERQQARIHAEQWITGGMNGTKTHWTEESNPDCHILLDTDLAILGTPTLDYDSYAQAIRQEYRWVPEASYKTGRRQVLQAFLQRKRIYWTELVYVALEGQAGENIQYPPRP